MSCRGAILVAVLAGCASAPEDTRPVAPTQPVVPGPVISVEPLEGSPRLGELTRVAVTVANGSAEAILVRGIELPGQLPETERWLSARDGTLRYDAGREEWSWRSWSRGRTDAVFAAGLLLPGEALAAERWLRVRGPIVEVGLVYDTIPLGELWKRVWTRRPERGLRATPRPEVRYERPDVSAVSEWRRSPPGSEQRVVIAPDSIGGVPQRRQVAVALPGYDDLVTRASLDAAGLPGGEAIRWEAGAAWILRRPSDGLWEVYGDAGDATVVELVDPRVFDLADVAARAGTDLVAETPNPPSGRGGVELPSPSSAADGERGDDSFDPAALVEPDVPATDAASPEDAEAPADAEAAATAVALPSLEAWPPEGLLDLLERAGENGWRYRVSVLEVEAGGRELFLQRS